MTGPGEGIVLVSGTPSVNSVGVKVTSVCVVPYTYSLLLLVSRPLLGPFFGSFYLSPYFLSPPVSSHSLFSSSSLCPPLFFSVPAPVITPPSRDKVKKRNYQFAKGSLVRRRGDFTHPTVTSTRPTSSRRRGSRDPRPGVTWE